MHYFLFLLLAHPILAATGLPNIVGFRYNYCTLTNGNIIVSSCRRWPSVSCCVFPPLYAIRAVYIGLLPLPGGVGIWHWPDLATQRCGRSKDAAGAADSVCMTDDDTSGYTDLINGGGAKWLPVGDFVPNKWVKGVITKQGTWSKVFSKIKKFKGFTNFNSINTGGSFRRRYSTTPSSSLSDLESRDNNAVDLINIANMTREELQNITDTMPEPQCQGIQHYADVFGWESGSKGVWVLENVTKEQYEKLASFPKSEDETVLNGYLAASEPYITTLTKNIRLYLPS